MLNQTTRVSSEHDVQSSVREYHLFNTTWWCQMSGANLVYGARRLNILQHGFRGNKQALPKILLVEDVCRRFIQNCEFIPNYASGSHINLGRLPDILQLTAFIELENQCHRKRRCRTRNWPHYHFRYVCL
jgi:hypothetical protein